MTTILGVKTVKDVEPEAIVLASDTQLTEYEDGKVTKKMYGYKLISGTNWAMGYAGLYSDELEDFFNFLRARKKGISSEDVAKEIKKSIEEGCFKRVNQLNGEIWRDKEENGIDWEDLNTFVLAVNDPALALYKVDEYGSVIPPPKNRRVRYLSVGSGKKATEYIEEMISSGKIDPNAFGIDAAVKQVFEAMSKAERDIHTGGPPDIIVLTADKIEKYGKIILENRMRADIASMEYIISKYVQPKEQAPTASQKE